MSRSGAAAGQRDDLIAGVQKNWASAHPVIDEYYRSFNERRFVDAAALFGDSAVLQQLPQQRQEPGSIGYLQFVSAWLKAFPDAAFIIRRITSDDGRMFEVTLDATGTHQGPLDFSGWVFRPTGLYATFGIRELLEVRDGKIVFSSLTLNLHEIVDKLAKVDSTKLLEHIERLRQLAEALREVPSESMRARELTAEIGVELDSARHVVRPYYRPR
jgi:predicted ester cyclase